MLVAAAVCPHPPLLVPEVGPGLGSEVETLRADCAEVVAALLSVQADRLYVVGSDGDTPFRSFAPWAPASGVENVAVDVPEPLPLALLIGAHLTRGIPRSFVVVDPMTGPDDCVDLGVDLAASAERVALLVMGDGSARHDVKAPGYVDPRAMAWDQSVHTIFRSGDLSRLATLDADLGEELLCAGRAPWQALAGAVANITVRTDSARLTMPFGVGYHVARWTTSAGKGEVAAKG
jgi:hypothetical protein